MRSLKELQSKDGFRFDSVNKPARSVDQVQN